MHALSLLGQGAYLRSLSEAIDTESAASKLQLHVLAAVGQFQCDLLHEWTLHCIRAAKARGADLGRRRVFDGATLDLIRRLLANGESPVPAVLKIEKSAAYAALRSDSQL